MSSYIQAIWDYHQSRLNWTPEAITVKVARSLEDDTEMEINLATTIGAIGRRLKRGTFYWLPKDFNENTPQFRTSRLSPYFQKACQAAGFSIMLKGWEQDRQACKFICQRGRYYKDTSNNSNTQQETPVSAKKSQHRAQKRIRPTVSEGTCRFIFCVVWSQEHSRWCVPKVQSGCCQHNGHTRDGEEALTSSSVPANQDPTTAYDFCLPIFMDATKNITTREQLQRFTAALTEAHADVLAMAPKPEPAPETNGNHHGTASPGTHATTEPANGETPKNRNHNPPRNNVGSQKRRLEVVTENPPFLADNIINPGGSS